MNDVVKSAIVLTTTAAISGFGLGVVNHIASHPGTQADNKSALYHNQQNINQAQLSTPFKVDSIPKDQSHEK
jgi:hypothetical protein